MPSSGTGLEAPSSSAGETVLPSSGTGLEVSSSSAGGTVLPSSCTGLEAPSSSAGGTVLPSSGTGLEVPSSSAGGTVLSSSCMAISSDGITSCSLVCDAADRTAFDTSELPAGNSAANPCSEKRHAAHKQIQIDKSFFMMTSLINITAKTSPKDGFLLPTRSG